MQSISRIPKVKGFTLVAAQEWFSSMQEVGLLFHPDDDPGDIFLIATNTPVFTATEVAAVRIIMVQLFESFGDGVYKACYPVAMRGLAMAAA
ncbi:hypothetical protein [Stutzerimonas stutzeri]|uniref:hypothetical protein n=1 Tax=Stutzerimonas stutzeri TaxID=316 RepID=UPI00210DF112|nr:hypothetical protein [Stutzerimonas stutzeri]MCQ4241507.1 hypothetical protein [Stutzerimonas stutzeri]